MKTDLEILIEHLEAEYDYLKSSMDECVSQWDFNGAKAFREPLIYTRSQLYILNSLKNPNHMKMSRLASMISRMELSLTSGKFGKEYGDEVTRERIEEQFSQFTKNRIAEYRAELEELKSIVVKERVDDDKILELLDDLDRKRISSVEMEIVKEKIFLLLTVNDEHVEMALITRENVNIEDYLMKPANSILEDMGFNVKTYIKQISNFRTENKARILEELAIIYFEIFGIFGEERNIRIVGNTTDNIA